MLPKYLQNATATALEAERELIVRRMQFLQESANRYSAEVLAPMMPEVQRVAPAVAERVRRIVQASVIDAATRRSTR